jgi:uncharacterized protein YggE
MVEATVADMRVGAQVRSATADAAQDELTRQMAPVLNLLKDREVDALKTGHLTLYPEYSDGKPRVLVGYRASMDVSFSTDVDEAGPLLVALVDAGATEIHNVSVRPTREALIKGRTEALRIAAVHARAEARILFDALGLEESSIVHVDINSTPNSGYSTGAYKSFAMAEMRMAPEIMAEEQEVTASVTLHISFES